MRSLWLQLPLVLGLALVSWISGMDSTGTATQTYFLWAATALTGAFFAFRLLLRAR
jgi:hypothetical protein